MFLNLSTSEVATSGFLGKSVMSNVFLKQTQVKGCFAEADTGGRTNVMFGESINWTVTAGLHS